MVDDSDDLGSIGIGMGLIEEGADYVRASKTIVIPVLNESGKAIAGWKVISKSTGQVLKYVKYGASSAGSLLPGHRWRK